MICEQKLWDSMVQRRFIYSSDYEELKKYCHNHIKSEFIQEIIERTMSV